MTERKTFKRRVRERMEKTGERYTAARRHVVQRAEEPEQPQPTEVSPEALTRRTGRTHGEWFALLDEWRATERPHAEIARHLREEHGISGWWAQMVTVEYERARGLRAKHERPDGFSIGVSRTVGVPVERLYEAFADEEQRERWLPEAMRPRTAQPGRSARFDWEGGESRLHVYFEAKGPQKSTVSVQHERLPDAEAAERGKGEWRERLGRLKTLLEGEAAGE